MWYPGMFVLAHLVSVVQINLFVLPTLLSTSTIVREILRAGWPAWEELRSDSGLPVKANVGLVLYRNITSVESISCCRKRCLTSTDCHISLRRRRNTYKHGCRFYEHLREGTSRLRKAKNGERDVV